MNRKFIFLTLILTFLLLITACASKNDSSNISQPHRVEMNSTGSMDEPQEEYDMAAADSEDMGSIQPEKVITIFDLGLETADFDEFTEKIEDIIGENEGYIQYSNLWHGGHSRTYRRGEYVVRVPRGNINKFKDHVAEAGNLINESTNRQDVTTQYRDTESRLRVVETKEERILELLETADLMSDIIELERELNNIVYEKELLTSELMGLDDKIDYSTVNLYVEEVERYSTTEDIDTGLGDRIKNAFKDSIHFFYNTMENLIIFLVYSIPFLIVVGVLALLARRFYKKNQK